jgi:hypothetical protein
MSGKFHATAGRASERAKYEADYEDARYRTTEHDPRYRPEARVRDATNPSGPQLCRVRVPKGLYLGKSTRSVMVMAL